MEKKASSTAHLTDKEKKALLSKLLWERVESQKLPLSFEQERLWILEQLEEVGAAYHIPQAYRLRGELNVEALEKSINEVVARHDVLRTRIVTDNGEPRQRIMRPASLDLPIIDLQGNPPEEQEEALYRLAIQEACRPFTLDQGPCLRVCLFKVNQAEHVLLVTVHHIFFDGWSAKIFWQELAMLYEAYTTGVSATPLLPLPIQYVDYAQWQRDWLQGEMLEAQLDYWKKQLEGVAPVLALPTDHSRPPVQTYQGAAYAFTLPDGLTEPLKRLSQQEQATLFMTLLTAFKVLLYRYTSQSDIVVGTPVAGRNRLELEGLIGFFVNTLVLRTDLSGNLSFRELLRRVREMALAAYDHQDVPFARLVQELQPERDLSYNPLFQVMFALENEPPPMPELIGLDVESVAIERGTTQFDLSLMVEAIEGSLKGTLRYNTDLFESAMIVRMAGHLEQLLKGIVANPDQPIGLLPLLTEAERHQILVEWNDTKRDYPQDKCIHELFEEQVERTPEATAVIFEDQTLTYRELNQRANQLAHYLRQMMVGPEVLVGICMERSIEMVVGILGILKAGGAYVPLDPNYPQERLNFMLEDTEAAVLITQEHLKDKLPAGHQAKLVFLNAEWEKLKYESELNLNNTATSQNLAYVIYTSGSTGKPKGVAIIHQNTVALLSWAARVFTSEELKGVLAATSICFDLSVYELFFPLSQGGTIVLVRDALCLLTLPTRELVTLINTVPSVMNELVRANTIPDSVKTVNLAGESLKRELVQQVYQQTKVQRVYNLYGPSEDTTYSTFVLVQRNELSEPTVGRPISNTQAYVLDNQGQPVPIGVMGELYLGGAGVSRGYLNRPDISAERYVPNLFSPTDGGRLYKTGDLVRYLADGRLAFLGRTDRQVKIRGYRIELGEIEFALAQHPSVREVAVVVQGNKLDSKKLVAYIITTDDKGADIGKLRGYLERRLPSYMIPSLFLCLDALPLTVNGKTDYRSLLEHDPFHLSLDEPFIKPNSTVEKTVAKIWEDILGLRSVGANYNFFDYGGNSLLALQIVSRVNETFNVRLPLRTLFTSSDLRTFSRAIEQQLPERKKIEDSMVFPLPRDKKLPASFVQEEWLSFQNGEEYAVEVNLTEVYLIKGALDIDALVKSFHTVMKRHESLRTTFNIYSIPPSQIIHPEPIVTPRIIDLQHLSPQQQKSHYEKLVIDESKTRFNSVKGPLLKVYLIKLSEQENVLLIISHHLVVDGWSMGILHRELSALYDAFLNSTHPALPNLEAQYADYATWERSATMGKLSKLSRYWRNQFQGLETIGIKLPLDYPYLGEYSRSASVLRQELDQSIYTNIQAICLRKNSSLFSFLFAVYLVLLYKYSETEDLLVTCPYANREHSKLENVIGWFSQQIYLRIRLSPRYTFNDLLDRVNKKFLEVQEHQLAPRTLFEKLIPVVDMKQPYFRVGFSLEYYKKRTLPGLEVTALKIDKLKLTSPLPLNLIMLDMDDKLIASLFYYVDLFAQDTMAAMLKTYRHLLRIAVTEPNSSVNDMLSSLEH